MSKGKRVKTEKAKTRTRTKTKRVKLADFELSSLISSGNIKLPTETAIFNMGTATDCPSLAKGLCVACKDGKIICYAMKAEIQYPDVKPYRVRQSLFWKKLNAQEFAAQFIGLNGCKRKKYTAIRLNESGDFWGQACVDKAEEIATILKDHGVTVYCYTARKDLDFSKTKNLVINGSGFQKAGVTNEFRILYKGEKRPAGYAICPADCKICNRCQKRGKKTLVKEH